MTHRPHSALFVAALPLALISFACAGPADPPAAVQAAPPPSLEAMLEAATVVDLSHTFDDKTLYWPTDTAGFRLNEVSKGMTEGGFFYAANSFSTAEHGGTHLDAPIHFAEKGVSAEALPLGQLLAPAVVIDVSEQAAKNPDYRLTPEDLAAFEKSNGEIAPGSIVLLRTGWSKFWGDRKAYFGDDRPGVTTDLHFPSYGLEAAQVLIEQRKVAALGLDTPSIDYGPSKDFPVHRLAGAHNVAGFENLKNLECLPAKGAYVIALPMKIGGGSGAPLRAVALLPAGTSVAGCAG